MAKKQKANKSQAVRDFVGAHPEASNKEIAETLTKQGLSMTGNYVANVKGKMGKKSKRRGSRRAKRVVATQEPKQNNSIGVSQLKAAFALLKVCENTVMARNALAAAVEIKAML